MSLSYVTLLYLTDGSVLTPTSTQSEEKVRVTCSSPKEKRYKRRQFYIPIRSSRTMHCENTLPHVLVSALPVEHLTDIMTAGVNSNDL